MTVISLRSASRDNGQRELRGSRSDEAEVVDGSGNLTPRQAWCLYISHFLSMWNSRIYEYSGVLFAHSSFPGTLLPTSLIGISETICMIVSATALGQWVDSSSNRVHPLVTSIIVNRVTVSLCCLLWLVIANADADYVKRSLFGVILVLGMVEKTTRMSNVLSMERDWIPTLASDRYGHSGGYDLVHLNTIIRRIDITCKFLTPLVASGLMATLPGPATTVPLFIIGFILVGVLIEITGINMVWQHNSTIRQPKTVSKSSDADRDAGKWHAISVAAASIIPAQIAGLRFYFSTSAWVPSFGIAILHTSVLDWAGTLITWLLNAGFTYTDLTVAKGAGTVFEIGSTFVFPIAASFFARRMAIEPDRGAYQMVSVADKDEYNMSEHVEDVVMDDRQEPAPTPRQDLEALRPIIQAGKWGICSLFAMIIPATIALFFLSQALKSSSIPRTDTAISSPDTSAFSRAPVLTILFFAFLSFSFVGRWVYDLSVTQLTQVAIPESHRSEFGGAEMALIAMFQFAHWIASAIWSDQDDFKWLGLVSLMAVAAATGAFLNWHRKSRLR